MTARVQFPPWRHESELALVRDWFFPARADVDVYPLSLSEMRQRAIDKVNLWLFKTGHLPPAVLATAGLTEALLHDEPARRARSISDAAMQSIYAMAFARFVNAFVDRDVARTHLAAMALEETDREDHPSGLAKGEGSMYALATSIGMPSAFVDLRHQVTHGHIPDVRYLRTMTVQALDWLWERWWVKHATGNPRRAWWEIEERRTLSRESRETEMATSGHVESSRMLDSSYDLETGTNEDH